ncbi:MAG: sigma-70 family RNA polymerase sigma factor [Planctomycetes bacterium]|nr:sigma-70 family RNA polymerase sigma factor [Planctomycetota bacterium]
MVHQPGYSDDDVAAAAGGDADSRDVIAQAMGPLVRMMVIARLKPSRDQWHVIDDLSQQVMVGVLTGLERLERRTVQGLKAYASRIVSHKVADYLKQPRSPEAVRGEASPASPHGNVRWSDRSSMITLWRLVSAGGPSPRTRYEQQETLSQMLSALSTLKDSYQEVITHAFFDQMLMSDIARMMGMSRPAASMLLIRAIKALRQEMSNIPGLTRLASDGSA